MDSKKYNQWVNVTKKGDSQIQRNGGVGGCSREAGGDYTLLGVAQGCIIVQHGEYGQYFVITVNGV